MIQSGCQFELLAKSPFFELDGDTSLLGMGQGGISSAFELRPDFDGGAVGNGTPDFSDLLIRHGDAAVGPV